MDNIIDKVIDLVKKTSDKVIIVDRQSNNAYVLLDFVEYQKLYSERKNISQLTENELLDKINRDIALWKSSQEDENFGVLDEIESIAHESSTLARYNTASKHATKDLSVNTAISPDSKEEAEDTFYFEPIE